MAEHLGELILMVMYLTHIKVKVILIFFLFFTEISSHEIFTIEIDGSNLPDDSGTITEGQKIFLENCKGCHGFSGEGLYGPELVGRSSLSGENISKTLGNYWPYAPKIFDYIKRAKRKENDSYFSNYYYLYLHLNLPIHIYMNVLKIHHAVYCYSLAL